MKKYDTHVCLVSEQLIPNYIPILDETFRPQEVILLVTNKMQAKANVLKKLVQERCAIHPQIIAINDPYDMQELKEKVITPFASASHQKNIALNVTGGNKLMAIAAYELFRAAGHPAFYFTVDSNEIIHIGTSERQTLQPPQIIIDDYFQLYGYKIAKNNQIITHVPRGRQAIGEELILQYYNYADVITMLNGDIGKATDNNKSNLTVELGNMPYKLAAKRNKLLELFEKHGLLIRKNNSIVFRDQDARQYVHGGWLEEYIFNKISEIPEIQGIGLNVQIENSRDDIGQHNELDIAFLIHNVLHVIECKTANYNKKSKEAENALYKLETLKKLGGVRTKTAFASYRNLKSHTRERAEGAQIKVFEINELLKIRQNIEQWIKD